MNENVALQLRDNARHQLLQIKDVETGVDYLNKVKAIEVWAKAEKKDAELQTLIAEQKIRTQRILGRLIQEGQERGELRIQGASYSQAEHEEKPTTLSEIGITAKQSMAYKQIASIPDETFEQVIAEKKKAVEDSVAELTTAGMLKVAKEIKEQQQKEERRQYADDIYSKIEEEAKSEFSKVCDIRCCSMMELLSSGVKPDCIITDPPYPKEYLPVYEELAELAKDIPLVAVMCGQSYLPEIYAMMSKHLKYRWTLAYLTPGGQAVQQWQVKVNTFWKPILLFGESVEWFGDVCKSDVNDNDKRFHNWGQSESGMLDLIERLTVPGQIVCDPFVGGGTTAVAALKLRRRFVGCDIDENHVKESIKRSQLIYSND